MKVLILNLNSEYFDDIKNGIKPLEYREIKPYWIKKLVNRHYEMVSFRKGYPKANDFEKIITVPYRGYEIKKISHKHFGNKPLDVFAIRTS